MACDFLDCAIIEPFAAEIGYQAGPEDVRGDLEGESGTFTGQGEGSYSS